MGGLGGGLFGLFALLLLPLVFKAVAAGLHLHLLHRRQVVVGVQVEERLGIFTGNALEQGGTVLELIGVEALERIDAVLVADGFCILAAGKEHIGDIADLPDGVGKQLAVAAVFTAAEAQLGAGLLHFTVQLPQMTGGAPFHQLLQLLGLLGGRQRLHHALFFAGDENRLRRAAARQDVVGKLTESLCEAVDHVAHFLFAPLAENKAHDDGENHHRITDTNNPLHEKILLKTGGPAGGRRRKLFADDEAKCPADKSRIREKTCQPGKHMLHFC